jgi:hypothetical protein
MVLWDFDQLVGNTRLRRTRQTPEVEAGGHKQGRSSQEQHPSTIDSSAEYVRGYCDRRKELADMQRYDAFHIQAVCIIPPDRVSCVSRNWDRYHLCRSFLLAYHHCYLETEKSVDKIR